MSDGDADKFERAIVELKNKRPFDPFRIVTAKGEKILVERPDQMAICETRIFCFYPGSDRHAFIRPSEITAVEEI
jgi:hypothetical protein